MKEIITPGNKGIEIKYYNTCPYCGCYYSYQSEDMYNNYGLTNMMNVLCPCCGRANSVAGGTHPTTWPPFNPICYYNSDKKINEPKEQSDYE